MKGNAKDQSESLVNPSDDSQCLSSVPKCLSKFLWVRNTHRKLFRSFWGPQFWARGWGGWVNMFWTCFKQSADMSSNTVWSKNNHTNTIYNNGKCKEHYSNLEPRAPESRSSAKKMTPSVWYCPCSASGEKVRTYVNHQSEYVQDTTLLIYLFYWIYI